MNEGIESGPDGSVRMTMLAKEKRTFASGAGACQIACFRGVMDRANRGCQVLIQGIYNELKNRGMADILIAVVDGLRGFAEAIEAVYRPEA